VSRSWRNAVRIALTPDRVLYARYGRWRSRPLEEGELPVAINGGGSWQAAVAVLPELLARIAPRPVDTTVVLSNHFARFMVLEANVQLVNEDEWQAYASHQFEKNFGARVREWAICITGGRRGGRRLACAIDRALLDAIAAAFAQSPARLESVEPYLMTAFNHALTHIRATSFWFALQEPGRLMLGLVRDGHWHRVRSRRTSERWHEEIAPLIEHENAIAADDTACAEIVVSALDAIEVAADGDQSMRVRAAPARGEGRYAMVSR